MSMRDRIVTKIDEVPALPAAATEVLRRLQDPDTGVAEVMQAIEYDPGLTSNVLRLANSAYFAGPRSIASLREAGVRLGTQRIFQLVITSAISPMARQPVQRYDIPAGQLMEHLVAVAVGAEELARTLGLEAPPHTFTTGLLHDVGKVVMGTFADVDITPVLAHAQAQGLSFEQAEAELLGIDHTEAGALLLQRWQLPENVVAAVRWHHAPDQYPGDDRLVVDLVHVAVNLSMECGIGVGADGLQYQVSPGVASRLKLKPAVTERVGCAMLTGLGALRPLFMEGDRQA